MGQAILLWELQEVENTLEKIKERFENRASLLAARENLRQLKATRGLLQARELEKKQQKKELRQRERKNIEIDEHMKEITGKIYGGEITNSRELAQLEKKLQLLKDEKEQVEEEILRHMGLLDALEEEIVQVYAREKEEAGLLQELKKKAEKEGLRLKEEYQGYRRAYKELEPGITPDLLRRYQLLRKSLGNCTLAPVQEGICGGCRVSLSSSQLSHLHTPGVIDTCDYCGRLMFLESSHRQEQPEAGGQENNQG